MRYLLLAMCVAGVACAKGASDIGDDDDDGQGGASSSTSSGTGASTSTSSGTGGASSTSSGVGGGCGASEMLCGGICTDIMFNNANCGACGVVCMGGEECQNGACTPASSSSSSTSSSSSSSSTSSTSTSSSTASSTSSTSTSGTCQPLNPVPGCGSNAHCAPQTNGVPLCVPPVGSGTQYSSCTTSADCAAIYECAYTGYYNWCMQWCSNDFDCPGWPLDTCNFFATPVYVGTTEWGACWDGAP